MMDDGGSCKKCCGWTSWDEEICNKCLLIGDFSNNEISVLFHYAMDFMDHQMSHPPKELLIKVTKALTDYQNRKH